MISDEPNETSNVVPLVKRVEALENDLKAIYELLMEHEHKDGILVRKVR